MEEFKFGDILMGKKTHHPIIFMQSQNTYQFLGCIITHSSNFKNNIPMLKDHFLENDYENNQFTTLFDNSHLVELKLIKKQEWGPFTKTGKLSSNGEKFVKEKFKNTRSIAWSNYMSASKSDKK